MMNKEDLVTHEQALALKKLGFIEPCTQYYTINGYIVYNPGFHDEETGECVDIRDLYRVVNTNPNSGTCDAPTLAQAQKWLNVHKDLKLFVIPSPSNKVPYSYVVFNTTKTIYKNPPRYWYSYEESLSAGITECIKLLEKED